jgi:two-component system sensor histidine kinase YesM
MEEIMKDKISQQSYEQLSQIRKSLESLMEVSFRAHILFQQDKAFVAILKDPQGLALKDRLDQMESIFKRMNNSLFLSSPPVYFTVLDFHGNVYTSYAPRKPLNYEEALGETHMKELIKGSLPYKWVTEADSNNIELAKGSTMATLYAVLSDEYSRPYGYISIGIDFKTWMRTRVSSTMLEQSFFVITESGTFIEGKPSEQQEELLISRNLLKRPQAEGYYVDKATDSLINYSQIPSLKWILINRIPLNTLFDELSYVKKKFFLTFIILTLLFMFITFAISLTVTKPLGVLEVKMNEAVRYKLNIHVPETNLKGEIFSLTQTFNQMINDTNTLVQQLKQEERQKEALKFEILLSQMNPHFILNTLNTIKWMIIRERNEDSAEMCVSLATLLENSLNLKVEVIHLKRELELVEAYLYIQQFRYKGQFEVVFQIEDGLNYALVPKLSLQPLVENAIEHGFHQVNKNGRIVIKVYNKGNSIVLEVEDNGAGLNHPERSSYKQNRKGIGIQNLRERLQLLFREQASLELIALEQGTRVLLELPLLVSTPHVEG